MNTDLLMSWLRTILKLVGSSLASYGYFAHVGAWATISGVIVALVGAGMSQWEHESDNGPLTKVLIFLGKSLPPPPAASLLLCALSAFALNGCAMLTGTANPAQQIVVIESDVTDGVRLAAVAEISQDPNSRQYFAVAGEALSTLTAQGATTLTQINAQLAKVVPPQYQDLISSVTQIAADKYRQWYTANASTLTAGQNAQYVLGVITAARDGISQALAATAPPGAPASPPAAN